MFSVIEDSHYERGQTILKSYPIDIFLLFVKEGSIVPYGQKMQYVDEMPNAPTDIRIYTEKDPQLTYYDDARKKLKI
ncbi:hypothetical protein LV716_07795 [Flagellimonas sp. HMM57]|uniref:hypothetical protein n=1 Tax=unclassified Flagellimonas TaxID=2644544 RepID=UPI0013CFB733|nr:MULTISPECIES: hypothetical protein [unclassified Flagellimonas]UII77660.1 hypothetical protein LV716_07795 [Flagellimonas sp. HMM57]